MFSVPISCSGDLMPHLPTAFALAIATCLAAATPTLHAQAETPAWSDAETAYFAARWLEADFALEDRMCSERKYRRGLAEGRKAFEDATPDYVAALAFAPRPALAEVTARKLADFAALQEQMLPMVAASPQLRTQLCDELVAGRAATYFPKQVQAAARVLATDRPPAPEAPLTTLASADVGAIVAIVLQHPEVAMYLHPDVPGRVPVRVAVAAPYDSAPVALSLYGAPVQVSDDRDVAAVQLKLKPHGDTVQVELKYDPEGIFGVVDIAREDGTWQATGARILE
jgi:hypothetical protein